MKRKRRAWTEDEDAKLREIFRDMPSRKCAQILKRSISSLNKRAWGLGLRKSEIYLASPEARRLRRFPNPGVAYRFAKGHVPANKGLRRPGYSIGRGRMRETQFKKGGKPVNFAPIGSLRSVDGYLYVKISDAPEPLGKKGGSSPNWKILHHKIWEDAGNPPVNTRTHALIFNDGNRKNCKFENLKLITRRENRIRNSIHRLYPQELKLAVMALGALKRKIRTREKRR